MEKTDYSPNDLPTPLGKRGDIIVVGAGSTLTLPEGPHIIINRRVEWVLDSVTLDFYDVLSHTGDVVMVFEGNLTRAIQDGTVKIVPKE